LSSNHVTVNAYTISTVFSYIFNFRFIGKWLVTRVKVAHPHTRRSVRIVIGCLRNVIRLIINYNMYFMPHVYNMVSLLPAKMYIALIYWPFYSKRCHTYFFGQHDWWMLNEIPIITFFIITAPCHGKYIRSKFRLENTSAPKTSAIWKIIYLRSSQCVLVEMFSLATPFVATCCRQSFSSDGYRAKTTRF